MHDIRQCYDASNSRIQGDRVLREQHNPGFADVGDFPDYCAGITIAGNQQFPGPLSSMSSLLFHLASLPKYGCAMSLLEIVGNISSGLRRQLEIGPQI